MKTTMRLILCAGTLLASTLTFAQSGNQGSINYFENYVQVVGRGTAGRNVQDPKSPQAYQLALKGASTDAQVKLLATLDGVQIDSETLLEMGQVVKDSVKAQVNAKIKNFDTVSESTMRDFTGNDPNKAGLAEVVLRVPLTGSGGVMNPLMTALRPEIIKRIDMQSLPVFQPAVLVTSTPAPTGGRGAAPAPAPAPAANRGAAPAIAPAPTPVVAVVEFDALLVRVPTGFKPALAPKIMSEKGEIVFSVKDVAADILISRGAAQYTNNEAKAKAILDNMGAKMILSVDGSLRTDTDAEVSVPDATKIYTSNKATSLLSKGRVVFLVAAKN